MRRVSLCFQSKRNRPDGSYATSDIFVPHPNTQGAYKYATRSDSTVVLINGKKFDPTPIEEELKKLPAVEEAIVFGQNRERPGIMVFRSGREVDGKPSDMVNRVISHLNPTLPPHARILPELILYMRNGTPWPKSSKGTVLRSQAEEYFKNDIDHIWKCYESSDPTNDTKIRADNVQVLERVIGNIVEQVVDRRIAMDEDFFMAGVDSMQATTIRKKIMDKVDMKTPLPTNAVFEQQNIRKFVVQSNVGAMADLSQSVQVSNHWPRNGSGKEVRTRHYAKDGRSVHKRQR